MASAYNPQALAPSTLESVARPCALMASPPACTSATPINAMQYQNTPPDAGQSLHSYGPSGEPNSASYFSPFVLTGHATPVSYEGMTAVPVAYSSVEAAAGPPCPVLPLCPTMTSHPAAAASCGGMTAPQSFITTVPALGGHYGAAAVTGGPMVVPIQCVDSGYGLSPYKAVTPSSPVCMAAASAPICESHLETPPAQWSIAQLVSQLEALLNREALSERRDTIIDCLIRSSPNFKLSAEALASHPLLLPATPAEILDAASMSSILVADFETQTVVPELRAKRLTLILRDVAPNVTAYHITSLLCQNSSIVPSEEKEAVLELAALQQPADVATNAPSSVGTIGSTPDSIPTPTAISFRGVSSFLTSLRFMGASSWYLALNDERLVEDLAWWLRGQMLQGAPVQVRIKTESPLRRGPLEFLAPASSFAASTQIQVHQPATESTPTPMQREAEEGASAVNARAANGRPFYRRRGVMGKQRAGTRQEKTTDPRLQAHGEHSDSKKPARNLAAIIGTSEGGVPRRRTRFSHKKNAAPDATQTENKRLPSSSQKDLRRSPGATSGRGRFASRNHVKPLGGVMSSTLKADQVFGSSHPSSEMDHSTRPVQPAKKGGFYARESGSGAQRSGYTKRHPASRNYGKTPQSGRQPRVEEAQKVVTPHDVAVTSQKSSPIAIGAQDFPPLCAMGSLSVEPTFKAPNKITSTISGREQTVPSVKKVDGTLPASETIVQEADVPHYSSSGENAAHTSGKDSEYFSSSLEKEQEATSGSETDQRKESTSVTTTTGSVTSTRNETTDTPTTTVSHDTASRLFWASCQKKLQMILKQDEDEDHSKPLVQCPVFEATEKTSVVIHNPTNQSANAAAGMSHSGKSFRQQHSNRAPGQNSNNEQQMRFCSSNDGGESSSRPDSNTAKNGNSTAALEGHGRRQQPSYAGSKQLNTGAAKSPQQQDGLEVQQRRRGFQQAKGESRRRVRNP